MTWNRTEGLWFTHPTLGGIVRHRRLWYWRPELPERGNPPWPIHGPYRTLAEAKSAAEASPQLGDIIDIDPDGPVYFEPGIDI